MIDNRIQFIHKRFKSLLEEFNIKKQFASVEHPYMNGHVEADNQVLLKGLERILEETKGNWADVHSRILLNIHNMWIYC